MNCRAADTDAEARRLFTSIQQAFLNIFRDTGMLRYSLVLDGH